MRTLVGGEVKSDFDLFEGKMNFDKEGKETKGQEKRERREIDWPPFCLGGSHILEQLGTKAGDFQAGTSWERVEEEGMLQNEREMKTSSGHRKGAAETGLSACFLFPSHSSARG